jgi:hypothetical protein
MPSLSDYPQLGEYAQYLGVWTDAKVGRATGLSRQRVAQIRDELGIARATPLPEVSEDAIGVAPEIRRRLVALIGAKGSQAAVALKMGLHFGTLSKKLQGPRGLTPAEVGKVLDALGRTDEAEAIAAHLESTTTATAAFLIATVPTK